MMDRYKKAIHLHDKTDSALFCILKEGDISIFFPLLQQGFQVTAKVGCDIQSMLCDQFEVMPEYVSNRINTVFLNGRPVDDVASAVVPNGATLSLSAAMPGLVGATFRKASCLASFRGTITHRSETNRSDVCSDGTITLKLFNLLLREVGPIFLKRGIRIEGAALRDCLKYHQATIQTVIEKITMDGRDLTVEQMGDLKWIDPDATVFLQIGDNS